jgi:nucleoside-diphosphate-sugar epimerase
MGNINHWICLAPLWVLPYYFEMLEKFGACRIVALSSTSRFTKKDSPESDEKDTARRLADGEDRLQVWAKMKGVDWVILRPTLIYGLGQDQNISEIVRFVHRFGFFPLVGPARGLRQPVHAEDVAAACLSALEKTNVANCTYNLSGGETLCYREMVKRVFHSLHRRPRLIPLPLWFFQCVAMLTRVLPRYRHWNMQMVKRINIDLVFDHSDAGRDLDFSPRSFQLTSTDLPSCNTRKDDYLQ